MNNFLELLVLIALIISTLIQAFTTIQYADAYTQKMWRYNNLAMCLLLCVCSYYLVQYFS